MLCQVLLYWLSFSLSLWHWYVNKIWMQNHVFVVCRDETIIMNMLDFTKRSHIQDIQKWYKMYTHGMAYLYLFCIRCKHTCSWMCGWKSIRFIKIKRHLHVANVWTHEIACLFYQFARFLSTTTFPSTRKFNLIWFSEWMLERPRKMEI